jgi:hypothetical protein
LAFVSVSIFVQIVVKVQNDVDQLLNAGTGCVGKQLGLRIFEVRRELGKEAAMHLCLGRPYTAVEPP